MGIKFNSRWLLFTATLLGLTVGQMAQAAPAHKKAAVAQSSADKKVAQTPNQEASDTSLGGLYVFELCHSSTVLSYIRKITQ